MKFFFTKYIIIEELVKEIDELDLSQEQKSHLSHLMDSSLHNAILDEILSNLTEDDKIRFLKMLHQDSESEALINFLKLKIDDIEDRIKNVSSQLIKEMHKDIGEAKKIR